MIHEARAKIGEASMALSMRAAQQADQTVCSCGGQGIVERRRRRPIAEVRSAQGRHSMQGIALRCEACGRLWRPVHELLGIESQYHSTAPFERLSSDFLLDKGSPLAARRLKEHRLKEHRLKEHRLNEHRLNEHRLKEHHGIEVGRTTVLQHA